MKYLCENGADTEFPSGNDIKSSGCDYFECTPLHLACINGNLPIVKYLCESAHADINSKEHNGRTPFLLACKEGRTDVVKYLFEVQNISDSGGEPAITLACKNGNLQTFYVASD